jgi:hypothetical protein
MLLFITKRRDRGSKEVDESFCLEIDCHSTIEQVKESIERMRGFQVKKQVLWCESCSGSEFVNSDTLGNPELDPSNLLLFVNQERVNVEILLCPMVKETPLQLQLDLVDKIGDVKSLIEEETAWWWNQEIQGYNKTIWMQLLDRKDRKMLQDSVLLEDMQVKQIAEDDTDTVQLYCNIEVHLSLQNKEDGVGVRTLVIMLNDVNMSINIEFEENRTVKDLKNVVLPLVEHRYLAFWFYQKGVPLSMEMLVNNLSSNEILLKD